MLGVEWSFPTGPLIVTRLIGNNSVFLPFEIHNIMTIMP